MSALAFVPGRPMLLSACRAGAIKAWNVENLALIGELRGHDSPINAICTNTKHVFTASRWVPESQGGPRCPQRVSESGGPSASPGRARAGALGCAPHSAPHGL